MKTLLSALLLLPLLATPAYAQEQEQESDFSAEQPRARSVHSLKNRIYKWTDNRGNVHYTQYKPQEFKAVELDPPPPPPSYAPDLNKKAADEISLAAEQSPSSKVNKKGIPKTNEAAKKRKCDQSKANLDKLLNNPKVTYQNASGEVVRMGEDEREARLAETRKNIDFFCK